MSQKFEKDVYFEQNSHRKENTPKVKIINADVTQAKHLFNGQPFMMRCSFETSRFYFESGYSGFVFGG